MARITLVSRNFPPLTGGMERLLFHLYGKLRQRHQVMLLGPAGCEQFVDHDRNVRSTSISPAPVFLLLSLIKGVATQVSGARPDIVIGGSGLVAPVILLLAKLSGAKTILLLHGLDIVAESRLYQRCFVTLFRRADLVICNSQNTARLASACGVSTDRIAIINPGVDVPETTAPQTAAKQSLGLVNKTVLLSIGRLIPRKGLAQFITNTFAGLAAANPDLVLVIAGEEPANALNRAGGSVLASIKAAIAAHDLSAQVRLEGRVSDAKIPVLYAAADVFVFPLVETRGDVEGFGMVAVEAAAHGAPTVAFDCGGVGDAIAEGTSGFLVPRDDYAQFGSAILRAVDGQMRGTAREFAARFSWDNYGAQVEQCITKVMS